MKREWEVNWSFFEGLAVAWAVFGFVVNFFVCLCWRDHNRHGVDEGIAWVHSPVHWTLPIWIAPFAVVACVLAVYGTALGLRELWRHPPVRRVTKPVVTDLREDHRR